MDLLRFFAALIVCAGCTGSGGSGAAPLVARGVRRMRRDGGGGFSLAELLDADDARIGGDDGDGAAGVAEGGGAGGAGDNYNYNYEQQQQQQQQQQQRPDDYYSYNVGLDVPAHNYAATAYQPDYSNYAFPASNQNAFAFPTEAPQAAADIQVQPYPIDGGQPPQEPPVEIYIDEAGQFQVRTAVDDLPPPPPIAAATPQPRRPTRPQGLLEQTGAYATYDGRPVFTD